MKHKTVYVVKTGFKICIQSNLLTQFTDIKHKCKRRNTESQTHRITEC